MISRKAPNQVVEMDSEKQEALLRRIAEAGVASADVELLRAVFESYDYVSELIEHKGTTINQLRKLLFGARTEKTANVFGDDSSSPPTAAEASEGETPRGENNGPSAMTGESEGESEGESQKGQQRTKGHGRNGAEAYQGAKKVRVPHATLKAGDSCPECRRGTVYAVATPGTLVRLVGQPPLHATVYELEKLRCHLCGKVFTAAAPPEAGPDKYDASSAAMIGLLTYGVGMPLHRSERLHDYFEIPLPASTQWDVLANASERYRPPYEYLLRYAAQGDVLYNDDTYVRILERMGKRAKQKALAQAASAELAEDPPDEEKKRRERTGLFTSGVVVARDGRHIALYFSGNQHAGENLAKVLKLRAAELAPPIQMSDALSRNVSPEFETIVANCIAHARRYFVDASANFATECRYVLESLKVAYVVDAAAKKDCLSSDERLRLHQQHTAPVFEALRSWITKQFDGKLIEKNSKLGAALDYLRKHWEKLTLFLRVAGAPLDNNICERALKKAIIHRKNSLFYKTDNGAAVGDLHMSLIQTCELNEVNPFDYLKELHRHAAEATLNPEAWLPWNYRETLATASPETAAVSAAPTC